MFLRMPYLLRSDGPEVDSSVPTLVYFTEVVNYVRGSRRSLSDRGMYNVSKATKLARFAGHHDPRGFLLGCNKRALALEAN